MVNIQLEGCDIDAPWLYAGLRPHTRPTDRVAEDGAIQTIGDVRVFGGGGACRICF